MLFEGFPSPAGPVDVKIFTTVATASNVQFNTWTKPKNKSFAWIYCVGGGGGGGGGFSAAAAAARGGGGGGGSSAQMTLLIPTLYLPDTLYLQVGAGGGGVASGTGGVGLQSQVHIWPNNSTAANTLCSTSGSTTPGGGTGTGAAVGSAGGAGSAAAIANCPLAAMGNFQFIAGQAGLAGGAVAGAVGTAAVIPVNGSRTMGGGGGAGTTSADFAGSGVTTIANSILSDMRPIAAAAGSNTGSSGYQLWKPFWSWSGMGGASSNAGVGGAGGHGGFGSGGGGGGGGTTGGIGGNGGNGLIVIACW